VSREAPARFCERRRVRLPPPTHLILRTKRSFCRPLEGKERQAAVMVMTWLEADRTYSHPPSAAGMSARFW
jgi:hypothetical protein